MRRKILAGISTIGILGALQLVGPSEAWACHKGKPHGGQIGVTVEPIQEDPLVCGRLL